MKLKLIAILVISFAVAILCDPHSQDDDLNAQPSTENTKKIKDDRVISREEFLKEAKDRKDLLGHTWTNLDMPNLEFYILPFINYSSSMLEPYFTNDQVRYHLEGNVEQHKQQINNALREWREKEPNNEIAKKSLLGLLENLDRIPRQYREKIRIHGGAYLNHALYFGLISPNVEEEVRFPLGEVRRDIEFAFQTFFQFKAKFNIAAGKIVGSGNAFLVRRPNGHLQIETMADNDTPFTSGSYPLLVLDMWEHAWYLKYKHRRSLYADDWWMLVDWYQVDKLNEYWKDYDQKKKERAQEPNEDSDGGKDEL